MFKIGWTYLRACDQPPSPTPHPIAQSNYLQKICTFQKFVWCGLSNARTLNTVARQSLIAMRYFSAREEGKIFQITNRWVAGEGFTPWRCASCGLSATRCDPVTRRENADLFCALFISKIYIYICIMLTQLTLTPRCI